MITDRLTPNLYFGAKKSKNRLAKLIQETPGSPVSDSFRQEINQGLQSTGLIGKQALKKSGTKVIIAQKTSDAFPELKGERPRGWPEGYTWDECNGFCDDNHIALFEYPYRYNYAPGTRHEVGHNINMSFSPQIGRDFTETEGYKKVYGEDIKNFDKNKKEFDPKERYGKHLDYLNQGSTEERVSSAGASESFAVLYAKEHGGSDFNECSPGFDEVAEKVFPETNRYVKKALYLLGKR